LVVFVVLVVFISMPELPEVESIKVQLQKYLIGYIVEDIRVNWLKTFPQGKEKIIGATISDVRRFGKVLVIDFNNDYSLVIHIKMTGQFIYRGPNLKPTPRLSPKVLGGVSGKHTHVIFKFKIQSFPIKSGSRMETTIGTKFNVKEREAFLYYNDVRKFGWMKVVKTNDLKNIALLEKMGPEPLFGLDLLTFINILKDKQNIKSLLMDQSKLGGIGNIYANDALYLAKINPTRKANSLSKKEAENLFTAIEEVLRRGIKAGGASENSYITPDGTEGNYQNIALVYGKEGKPCLNCKTLIKKIKLGGRGTYYCEKCQK
jgi:formamidopyrimidine-DNA glycosylase